jgi:hypothetical protein
LTFANNNADGDEIVEGREYLEALIEYADGLVNHRIEPHTVLQTNLPEILGVNTSGRNRLRQALYESLSRRGDDDIPPEFFKMFGEELSELTIVNQNKNTIYGIMRAVLKKRNVEGLLWFERLISINALSLKEGPLAENYEEIENYTRAAWQQNLNDEASPVLQRIANALELNNPEDIVNGYEKLLEKLVHVRDYMAHPALLRMKAERSFFSLPVIEDEPSDINSYRSALEDLGALKVKDEESLMKGIREVLDKIIVKAIDERDRP